MDHVGEIRKLITQFNDSIKDKPPTFTENEVSRDKEYKMPFEMKVFKKRVQKHNFYRNRHKTSTVKTDIQEWRDEEKRDVDQNTPPRKWTALNMIEKKQKIRHFLKEKKMATIEFTTLFRKIWKSVQNKDVKSIKFKPIRNIKKMGNGHFRNMFYFNKIYLKK